MFEGGVIAAFAALLGAVFGRAKLEEWYERELTPEPIRQAPTLSLPTSVIFNDIRPMPVMDRKPTPHALTPVKATAAFIQYMQDSKACGIYAASEVDEMWMLAREELNIADIPLQTIRSTLAEMGYCLGRKCLGIEYAAIRLRTGKNRTILYRLPTRAETLPRRPRTSPDGPGTSGPPPRHALGTPGNEANYREVA